MSLQQNSEIQRTSVELKSGMIEFMEYGETEYSKSDVEKCMTLINDFLIEIEKSDSKENGLISVKNIVLNLNELNESLGHELIETDQREQIADIIILAGHLKGYNERNEDTTEEWREW